MTALSLIEDRNAEMITGGYWRRSKGFSLDCAVDIDIDQTNDLSVSTYAFGLGNGLVANGVSVVSVQANDIL